MNTLVTVPYPHEYENLVELQWRDEYRPVQKLQKPKCRFHAERVAGWDYEEVRGGEKIFLCNSCHDELIRLHPVDIHDWILGVRRLAREVPKMPSRIEQLSGEFREHRKHCHTCCRRGFLCRIGHRLLELYVGEAYPEYGPRRTA